MDWPNHQKPWREWCDAMDSKRMHHGWILAGKAGLGKHQFARAAARALVAEEGIAQPGGDHPDIHILTHLPKDEKEEAKKLEGKPFQLKRNISVAQIRTMQQRLITRPTLGSRRAIIIDPADDLEPSASNALLKSLEEPPRGTFFLLVAHRPSRLLPTIRSRCRLLRFETLTSPQIERMLGEAAPSAGTKAITAAVAVSGGSFGAALEFLEQDLGAVADLMRRIVTEGDPALALRGKLSEAVGSRPDRASIQSFFDLGRMIVASEAERADPVRQLELVDVHSALVELAALAPSYNFDAGLLIMEIGSLLARAAEASERADA